MTVKRRDGIGSEFRTFDTHFFFLSYYRCSRYKTLCPGRCVVEEAKVRNSTEHNHAPEPDRVLVDKFRKVLTQRAANEITELYTIYWEEASQRHADAALLYTFTAAESAMRKARRKQLAQIPNSICELDDILANSSSFRISCGTRNDRFYQKTLNAVDATCAVFMHLPTLEAIGHIEELHMNFSVDVERTTPPVYHLMVVHAVLTQRVSEKWRVCPCRYLFQIIVFSFFSRRVFPFSMLLSRQRLWQHIQPCSIIFVTIWRHT